MIARPTITEVSAHALALYPGLLAEWLPGGRRLGHEYKCGDLTGAAGDSLSVNIHSGKWQDFASGERGTDPVSLYAAIHGLTQAKAAHELALRFGLVEGDGTAPRRRPSPPPRQAAPEPDFVQLVPAPAEPPRIVHRLGTPSRKYVYRTLAGALIGYVLRFDLAGGKKEVVPFCYGTTGTRTGWRFKQFTAPRPLYNLPALAELGRPVLVVEGEKCVDHAQALLPGWAVVSWPGGGKATGKVDWTPLAGRQVAIWPDADQPGYEAAEAVAAVLVALGCQVTFIRPPAGVSEGWDVADSDLTPESVGAWLKAHFVSSLDDEPSSPDAFPDGYAGPDEPPHPPAQDVAPSPLGDAPFRCLGFDRGSYYYFSKATQQIFVLTAAAHNKPGLLQLAGQGYWRSNFPDGKRQQWDVDSAADAMMRGCERAGIFNLDRMRGRGAWWDNGQVVMHLGDRIIAGGEVFAPCDYPSSYIYEASHPIGQDFAPALKNKEAHRLMNLLEMLPWAHPMHAKLCAGWCVVAHIGGVMHWRPHVWVVGKKGTGKTYVMTAIVGPMLGRNCVFVQSNSSEAGIRQTLQYDAMPVLFDEAEGEDASAHHNIQRVLGLIRQSSSETGGRIAKGTPAGKAQRYMIRSCFALSSINAALVQQSDRSRVTVLEMSNEHRHFGFDEIQAVRVDTITPAFVSGFYARVIALAPIIRENAVVFAAAAATVLGEQRAGDQVGTLLAGCYSLYSDKPLDYGEAVDWLKRQDWEEKRAEIKGQDDGIELFAHLLDQRVPVRFDGQAHDTHLRVGYLLDLARGVETHSSLSVLTVKKALQQAGFKPDTQDGRQGVWVANRHAEIAQMLRGYRHSVNWNLILKRLQGASTSGKSPIYFTSKITPTAAVFVPFDLQQ